MFNVLLLEVLRKGFQVLYKGLNIMKTAPIYIYVTWCSLKEGHELTETKPPSLEPHAGNPKPQTLNL